MGFFSWKTNDTQRSISNQYSSKKTFAVKMLDNKGNVWLEENYEGYGVFGGKDYYELLAEMNGLTTRDEGIKLYYHNDEKVKIVFPNLIKANNDVWEWKNVEPKNCKYQGFFYKFKL